MTPNLKKISMILAALIICAVGYGVIKITKSSFFGTNSSTIQKSISQDVPFTTQSPFAEWSDARQQDGCEEASAIMAIAWAKGIKTISPDEAKSEIISASDWELKKYGNFRDTSADDTAQRIIKEYFNYSKVSVKKNITADDIINELESNNLVIIPANGRALRNRYYSGAGPERHMLVITGYDVKRNEFITNDPGTRYGKNFRYGKTLLFNAIRDYATDNGESQVPVVGNEKNMIVISK